MSSYSGIMGDAIVRSEITMSGGSRIISGIIDTNMNLGGDSLITHGNIDESHQVPEDNHENKNPSDKEFENAIASISTDRGSLGI